MNTLLRLVISAFSFLALLVATVLSLFTLGCACAPTGETDSELAPLVFTAGVSTIELPATVRVRSGQPEIGVRFTDCAAIPAAQISLVDSAGEPLSMSLSSACEVRARVPATAAGATVDVRLIVTAPAGTMATGEIELVTYQDVCASVGSSEIVSFGI